MDFVLINKKTKKVVQTNPEIAEVPCLRILYENNDHYDLFSSYDGCYIVFKELIRLGETGLMEHLVKLFMENVAYYELDDESVELLENFINEYSPEEYVQFLLKNFEELAN